MEPPQHRRARRKLGVDVFAHAQLAALDKEANTLFLVKMLEHGRYLYEVEPAALTTNHAVSHAQGLLYIAQLFPEFSAARRGSHTRAICCSAAWTRSSSTTAATSSRARTTRR